MKLRELWNLQRRDVNHDEVREVVRIDRLLTDDDLELLIGRMKHESMRNVRQEGGAAGV